MKGREEKSSSSSSSNRFRRVKKKKDPWADAFCVADDSSCNANKRIETAISRAQSSGKLNLSNLNLDIPLPEPIFNFRLLSDASNIDLSKADYSNTYKYVEQEITHLDLSFNDFPEFTVSIQEKLIETFPSLTVWRSRQCQISQYDFRLLAGLDNLLVLDLSQNQITGNNVNDLFDCLPYGIQKVDLSGNQITSIDCNEEKEFPNLTELNLSQNNLSSFCKSNKTNNISIKCPNLHTLLLNNNPNLKEIPFAFLRKACCQDSLVILEAKHCSIKISSSSDHYHLDFFAHYKKLQNLDLSYNNLESVVRVHFNLKRLALNHNQITSFAIQDLYHQQQNNNNEISQLSELNLRSNKLQTLSVLSSQQGQETNKHSSSSLLSFEILQNLVVLDVGENNLRDLPTSLGYLENLRKIIADRNPTRVFNTSWLSGEGDSTLQIKKSLRMRMKSDNNNNNNNKIDSASTVDTTTTTLCHAGLNVKQIVNDAFEGSHTLNLSHKSLTSLPPSILHEIKNRMNTHITKSTSNSVSSAGIKNLEIHHNHLDSIPHDWVHTLISTPSINMKASYNLIQTLPQIIFECSGVEILELARNKMTSDALSQSLMNVSFTSPSPSSLTVLNLSSNLLNYIPTQIFHLAKLQSLILSHNQITSLEDWTPTPPLSLESQSQSQSKQTSPSLLPNLEFLDLSNNKITQLMPFPHIASTHLPSLKTLLIHNNELRQIPCELSLLSDTIHKLDVTGNPQKMINYALIEKGTPAIMNFLKFRMENSSKSSNRNNKDQNDKKVRVMKTESVHHQVQEKKNENVHEEKMTKKQNNDYKSDKVDHQSTNKPQKKSTNSSLPLSSTTTTLSTTTPSSSIDDSSLIILNELSKEIDELKSQIENGFSSLSQAKSYALKKRLAMARAKYIREERRFKQQQAQEGQKS